jgi:hypothetical protein
MNLSRLRKLILDPWGCETCPRCLGRKTIFYISYDTPARYIPCPTCEATGVVPYRWVKQ